ncbi:MAG TPA: hypothetical protein V6C78_16475 [Crinalium sp.]
MSIQTLSAKTGVSMVTVTLMAGVLPLGTLPPSTSHLQVAQSASTIFENVTLSPNFSPDPTTVRGISGGPRLASDLAGRAETATGPCNGYVDEQPDHTIVLTQFFSYLRLQVQSPADTTIVVRGPGGTWCNDDYQGKDPGIAGQWLSGTYQVWIGSYESNRYDPYVIRISEAREPSASR